MVENIFMCLSLLVEKLDLQESRKYRVKITEERYLAKNIFDKSFVLKNLHLIES